MDRGADCGLDGGKSVAAPMRVHVRLRSLQRGLVPEGPMKVAQSGGRRAAAHARQHKRLRSGSHRPARARESVPQGDLKVAHYEVVGNGVKDSSVPKGRSNPQSLARIRPRERKQPIDRPLRDGSLLKKRVPPLRSGLLSNVPPGRGPLRMLLSLMLTCMGGGRTGLLSRGPCGTNSASRAYGLDCDAHVDAPGQPPDNFAVFF